MEYKKYNVAKLIAFAVIASVVMETVTAAPLVKTEDERAMSTTKQLKNHKKKNQASRMEKKNINPDKFTNEDVGEWQNPCKSINFVSTTKLPNQENYNTSYDSIKLIIQTLNTSFVSMTTINTSDVGSWEKFHSKSYSWLPLRPTGLVLNWHMDTQIYVATFTKLYKIEESQANNNNTTSAELKELKEHAQELLCQIEIFVNATANRGNKLQLYWYEKREMMNKVELNKTQQTLNNLFVKARFEQYIDRMYKRIKNFNWKSNLEVKSFKRGRSNSTKTTRKQGKGSKRIKNRRRRTTTEYNGEQSSSPKTFIITTKRGRRGTRLPGSHKHNKINQRLQE